MVELSDEGSSDNKGVLLDKSELFKCVQPVRDDRVSINECENTSVKGAKDDPLMIIDAEVETLDTTNLEEESNFVDVIF